MQFEEAERLHQRLTRIHEVQASGGELARSIAELNGVAVLGSSEEGALELWFLRGGCWQEPHRLSISDSAGDSMDRRLRDIVAAIYEPTPTPVAPNLEHLSILMRWQGSSWRDGEWLGFDSLDRIPYRKLVNAIGRVHGQRLRK
jgi:hypothetical protein